MFIRYLRKKGFSTLSAITLFFVGMCVIPCGMLKEAHAVSTHETMAAHEMKAHKMAEHSCHGKKMADHDQISADTTSSCPHCKSEIPVIMQDAKIKYLSPQLPLKLAHWQIDAFSIVQKLELPEDDPPPGNTKHPIHILHSVFII